jgi:hypothetical protein
MRRSVKVLLLSVTVALISAPMQARAQGQSSGQSQGQSQGQGQGYIAPWVGLNWGSSVVEGDQAYGVDVGWLGREGMVVGGEFDFGYNPNFFGSKNDFGSNTGYNLMGNLVLRPLVRQTGLLGQSWHPYAIVGLGWIRAGVNPGAVSNNVDQTDNLFGWDIGGGSVANFATHAGLRVDLRYLRSFSSLNTGVPAIDNNESHLHWWRLSAGVVLR